MTILESKPLAPPQPLSAAQARLDTIDVLRGLACLWVIWHHCLGSLGPTHDHFYRFTRLCVTLANPGWLGVNLFLVLSGFCLYMPLIRKAEEHNIVVNIKQFARRRALRILPAYYAAFTFGLAFSVFHNRHDHLPWNAGLGNWGSIVLHCVMLFNLFPSTMFQYNGTFWSLALESQLYVTFPLLVFLAARYKLARVWLVALCVTAVTELYAFHTYGAFRNLPLTNGSSVLYSSLPARCVEFVSGMYAAAIVARPTLTRRRWVAVIAAALLPVCLWYAKHFRYGPFLDSTWGVEFSAIVVLFCTARAESFAHNWLFRALTWIGTISYSIYLLHFYFVWTFYSIYLTSFNSNAEHLGKAVLVIIASILAGYVFHRIFERPFMPGRPRTERQAEIAAAISPAP